MIDPRPADMADLLRMVASGLAVGLPVPYRIGTHSGPGVTLQVAADADRWTAWWADHGATGWRSEHRKAYGYTHHETTGHYRGAQVTVLHLTPAADREQVPA